MKLEVEDLSVFVKNPPEIEDMIIEEKDTRKKKNKILVIVPSYHETIRLKILLERFERQRFKNFDICLILASDDEFVENENLSLYQIKRKWDYGFAGSVYLGQKIALKDKYEYFLFADIDKLPYNKDTLYLLYENAKQKNADMVCGKRVINGYFLSESGYIEELLGEERLPPLFCLIRTGLLLKSGFYPLPLYMGHDDVEFGTRLLRSAERIIWLEDAISIMYCKPSKFVFKKVVSNLCLEHQYVYSMILCIRRSPQTINMLSFFKKVKIVFANLLLFNFMKLRLPPLKIIDKMSRDGKFGKIRCTGLDIFVKYIKTKKIQKKYTDNNRKMDVLLKKLFGYYGKDFFGNNTMMLEFFLTDRFYIMDEKEGKIISLKWRRKIPISSRIIAILSACLETCVCIVRSEIAEITKDRGIFWEYGIN